MGGLRHRAEHCAGGGGGGGWFRRCTAGRRARTRGWFRAVDGVGAAPVVVGHSYGGRCSRGASDGAPRVPGGVGAGRRGERGGAGRGSAASREAVVLCGEEGATGLWPVATGVPYGDCPAPLADRAVGCRASRGQGGRERRAGAAGVEDDPLDVRGVCPGPCDRPRVRRTAARCGGVREWRTGHSPSGGRPGLAGLVREVLAGLGGTAWRRTRAPLRADSCAGAPQGEGGRRRGLGGGRGAGRRLPPEDPRPSRSPPIPTPPAPGGRPPLTRSSARPATGARGAARRRRTVLPRRHPRTRCRTSFVRRSKVVRSRASALRRRRGSVLEGRRLNHQSGVVTVRPSRVSAVAPGWSA